MLEDRNIPVSRGDLTLTVHTALLKAECFWPKRRRPGDPDRLKLVADAMVDHIELCGMRFVRRAPERGRSTPDPLGPMPALGGRDDGG
ncbi:MAG: hypothetical protein OXG16_13940 [Rhodospirillales bacterium]|nr:hypothetical protein [Rhodospirillales bacterium]MDE0711173.1 hypothetical protein [Rhodospirillales bacterium]